MTECPHCRDWGKYEMHADHSSRPREENPTTIEVCPDESPH